MVLSVQIGACRHGSKCLRQHMKPTVSPTILLPNLYQSPVWTAPDTTTPEQEQEALENFYVEMFEELAKFGDIEQIYLCENTVRRRLCAGGGGCAVFFSLFLSEQCDHLIGNVYVRFYEDEAATRACAGLAGRFYAGRPIAPEVRSCCLVLGSDISLFQFSPVTDFREGSCRQHDTKECTRGDETSLLLLFVAFVSLFLFFLRRVL